MFTPVLMPKLGETNALAFTIEKWLVRQGDKVCKGQALLIVATDKASLEVEARADGILRRVLFPEGVEAEVGCVIAILGPAEGEIPAGILQPEPGAGAATPAKLPAMRAPDGNAAEMSDPAGARQGVPPASRRSGAGDRRDAGGTGRRCASRAAGVSPALPPSPVPLPREGPPRMSPRARRRARELLVPLQMLSLPLEGRRIGEAEVLAAARKLDTVNASPDARRLAWQKGIDLSALSPSEVARASPPANATGTPIVAGGDARATTAQIKAEIIATLPDAPLRLPAERVPMPPLRRAIAESMAYAQHAIPQFSVEVVARAGALLELRNRLLAEWGRMEAPGVRDFFLRALGMLLAEESFKPFRAVVDGSDLVYRGEINIGLAVALASGGVVVPVLHSVERAGLREVAARARELTERARRRRLAAQESAGALMTLSNLGATGVYSFRAIVRPGEAAILALPAAHPRPVQLEEPAEAKDDTQSYPLFDGLEPLPVAGPASVPVAPLKRTKEYSDSCVAIESTWLLSLSADHRLVDGALASEFLSKLKGLIEEPRCLI